MTIYRLFAYKEKGFGIVTFTFKLQNGRQDKVQGSRDFKRSIQHAGIGGKDYCQYEYIIWLLKAGFIHCVKPINQVNHVTISISLNCKTSFGIKV